MCILVYKPVNTLPLSEEHLWNCFRQNRDGAGFAFIDPARKGPARLRVHKGFFTFRTFFEAYKRWEGRLNKVSPFLVHFRIGTRGLKDKSNCHPFYTRAGIVLGHNGILNVPDKPNDKDWPNWDMPTEVESDTRFWSREWFCQFNLEELRSGKYHDATKRMIGTHNKIVLLDWKGRVVIFGHDAGTAHWYKGIWWSNNDYSSSYGGTYLNGLLTRYADKFGTSMYMPLNRTYDASGMYNGSQSYHSHHYDNHDHYYGAGGKRGKNHRDDAYYADELDGYGDADVDADDIMGDCAVPTVSIVGDATQRTINVECSDGQMRKCEIVCDTVIPVHETIVPQNHSTGVAIPAGTPITALPPPELAAPKVNPFNQPQFTLDHRTCVNCHKQLTVDLVGISSWCWECDSKFEKQYNFTNYEEQYYTNRIKSGAKLTPVELQHLEYMRRIRQTIKKVDIPPTVEVVSVVSNTEIQD